MYGSDSPCDVEVLNQAFIDASQYMNPVIADRSKKYNSLYRSKIERGVFTYGEGYMKMSHTFYGGTAVQDCGASWSAVEPSRPPKTNGEDDPGHDSCRYESEVINYGFKAKQYSLYQASRRTLDICLNDILFKWQYEKQLTLVYKMLANVTLGEWEQIEREFYIDFAQKFMVQNSNTGLGLATFTMTMGDCHIDAPAGGFGTIGTLTQPVLDRFYQYLYRQCPDGAVGMKDGMPQFALITSPETSTGIIRSNVTANTDMRYVNPTFLIEGYGTVSAYQGFAHVMDPQCPRFKVNALGTELVRVHPFAATATTIGEQVNVDTEYIMAPFELSVIFLKNVYKALVPPDNPTSIGGGYTFAPEDNFGDFNWYNIQDRCENIRKEKGFFFMLMKIAPEPGENSGDAIVILHKRCLDIPIVVCEEGDCLEHAVVACAPADATESLDTETEYDVELDGLLDCGPGQAIDVYFTDTTSVAATIVSEQNAPTYRIAFEAPTVGGWCAHGTGMASVWCAKCDDPSGRIGPQ